MGYDYSTIYKELRRGDTGRMDERGRAGYSADLAQKQENLLDFSCVYFTISAFFQEEAGQGGGIGPIGETADKGGALFRWMSGAGLGTVQTLRRSGSTIRSRGYGIGRNTPAAIVVQAFQLLAVVELHVLCHLFHPFPQKMRKKINAGESFGFLLRLFYNFSEVQTLRRSGSTIRSRGYGIGRNTPAG